VVPANAPSHEGARGTRAAAYGEHTCDTPLLLLQSVLDAGRQLKPDMVIWGGDTAPHASASGGTAAATRATHPTWHERDIAWFAIANATAAVLAAFPGIPVFPSLGDTDFSATHASDSTPPASLWLTEAVADLWGDAGARWLPRGAATTLGWRGHYEAPGPPGSGVMVAVLNTEACHVRNFRAFADPDPTPDAQLYWLEGVLARARVAGNKVVVAGHIPPGLWGGCWGAHSQAYEAVVAAASDVVVAQLFGHQHSGSFRLLRGDGGSAGTVGGLEDTGLPPPVTSVAFVTPSVTPYKDQDPSFRVYTVGVGVQGEGGSSEHELGVRGFEQYSARVADARSLTAGHPLEWRVTFDPSAQVAGMQHLRPAAMSALADRVKANATFLAEYRALEANGRPWMGSGHAGDYACSLRTVRDAELLPCVGKSEEILVRQYTGSTHTYVLTALYPFSSIVRHFCSALRDVHPSDCADMR